MIAGICNTRNEADIIRSVIQHMFHQGVDSLWFMDNSTDDTPEIIADMRDKHRLPIHLMFDDDPVFMQVKRSKLLADYAHNAGAEWIIPFDADEFFYPVVGEPMTLRRCLKQLPVEVGKLYCRNWPHLDWNRRGIVPLGLPKVIYRWTSTSMPKNGHHDVVGVGEGVWGIVDARHYQYRSFEHFVGSIRDKLPRVSAHDREVGDGVHVTRLEGLTDAEMLREWQLYNAIETVYDPIPCPRVLQSSP